MSKDLKRTYDSLVRVNHLLQAGTIQISEGLLVLPVPSRVPIPVSSRIPIPVSSRLSSTIILIWAIFKHMPFLATTIANHFWLSAIL